MGTQSTEATNEAAEQVEAEAQEETPEETPDETPQETPETPEDAPQSDDEVADEETSTLSHDDALKALEKTRREAANYRTRLRDAEQSLKDAKTPEEYQVAIDKIVADNQAESIALIRENVALRHGLPDDVAATLSGSTKDELEAHAKVLARYISPNNGDPELQGGLDPDSETSGSSHEEIAANVARIRHSRY